MPMHERHASRDYRAIWISDVHLGTRDCKADFLREFLLGSRCHRLYLLGDIVDLRAMQRSARWPRVHTEVLHAILGKVREGTEVVYVPGNHDEEFRAHAGIDVGGLKIRHEAVHETADGRRLLLLHGDCFDTMIKCGRLAAILGGAGYDLLLSLSRGVHALQHWCGWPHWSLARFVKSRVRNAMEYVCRFEEAAAREAARRGFHGIVCGHIHHARIRQIEGVDYYNCGDWVENCTALAEREDGAMGLIYWADRPAGRWREAPVSVGPRRAA